MSISNLYHEGELATQCRANETEIAQRNGGVVSKTIPAGALPFIEQQPMAVIGSMNPNGHIWASILFGQPGFIHTLDDHTLEIDLSQPRSASDDPLWSNLIENADVGLIIIELDSRRRLRINGQARRVSAKRLIIDIERAYPNCPKYIQRRQWKIATIEEQLESSTNSPINPPISTKGTILNETQKKLIANADTFFVTSGHPNHGLDASHRGGHPGFVQLINDQLLLIPDFSGNSMFNTLGNFTSYPFAGLVFVDFKHNCLLQLTGGTEVLWDIEDPQEETGGTQRYWQFNILAWQEYSLPFHLDWELFDYSPHIPKQRHRIPDNNTLLLRVERIQRETKRIKSFRLRAVDGGILPEFTPGAHLLVKVKLPDGSIADRHYSLLSDCRNNEIYEIAVLMEPDGRGGSNYMHQQINEGDVLECQVPKNNFPQVESVKHNILIAGGIGITPIFSMLQELVSEQQSFELHYSARTNSALALRDRIEKIAGGNVHFYSSHEPQGQCMNLESLLSPPKPNVHVYVCGPHQMISAVREISKALGWTPAQIHFESFGPKALAHEHSIRVHLLKSKKTLTISPNSSILDTLIDAGINVPHDCKRGECLMCVTRVLGGEPDHRDLCLSPEEQSTSMCICVSRAKSEKLKLDL